MIQTGLCSSFSSKRSSSLGMLGLECQYFNNEKTANQPQPLALRAARPASHSQETAKTKRKGTLPFAPPAHCIGAWRGSQMPEPRPPPAETSATPERASELSQKLPSPCAKHVLIAVEVCTQVLDTLARACSGRDLFVSTQRVGKAQLRSSAVSLGFQLHSR